MAVALGCILNLAARITSECWAEAPVSQVIRTSLPGGALIHLHAEDTAHLCFRNTLYRGLHAEGRWPVLSQQGPVSRRRGSSRRRFPAAYVMLGTGAWARRTVLQYPEVRHEWNSSALFLALVPALDLGDVEPMLWDAWRLQSVADFTVVLLPANSEDVQWQAVTAFPFAESTGLCGRVRGNATFRRWQLYRNHTWTRDTLFPPKLPKKLGGCALPVNLQYDANIFSPGYLNPEGYALAMLNVLTDYLDVTATRVPAPPDQFDTTPGAPDWSWYDALAGLESGDVDVLVGQYSYTDWRYDSYATLGPHGVSNYRWYLPVPLPSFLPIVPHLALPKAVLACIGAGLAATVAVMAFASTGSSVLHVWSMFVEQPISQSGIDGVTLASRVVVLSSLVSFVNVNVVIKSTIVTSMSRPTSFKGLQTTDELGEHLDHVVIGMENPLIITLLNISEVPTERALMTRTEECYLNFTECVHRLQDWALTHDGDDLYVLVCSQETMAFNAAGSEMYFMYTFDDPLHRNMYGWYGRKRFPMADRANRLFLLLQQSGLQALWSEMLSTNITAVNRLSPRHSDGVAHAIPFGRARNLFVMLTLGEACAVVVFLLELATARLAGMLVRKRRPPAPNVKTAVPRKNNK